MELFVRTIRAERNWPLRRVPRRAQKEPSPGGCLCAAALCVGAAYEMAGRG